MAATTRRQRTAAAGERYMSVKDFAVRIDVPRSTAYRIIAAGLIDVTNVSAGTRRPRLRISEAAFERYVAAREIKGRRAS